MTRWYPSALKIAQFDDDAPVLCDSWHCQWKSSVRLQLAAGRTPNLARWARLVATCGELARTPPVGQAPTPQAGLGVRWGRPARSALIFLFVSRLADKS